MKLMTMRKNLVPEKSGSVDWTKVLATTEAEIAAQAEADQSAAEHFPREYHRARNLPLTDVRALRESLGLSQSQFANAFGFSPRTIQQWEQGRARPDQPARLLLRLIERAPQRLRLEIERAIREKPAFSAIDSSYDIDIAPDQRVDVEVLDLNRAVILRVLYEMRPSSFEISSDPWDAAVQHWLVYLSMLIDVNVSAMVHLVCYKHHVAAAANMRMCIEYAARAIYFDQQPEEAWFELKYALKRRFLLAKNVLELPDTVAQLKAEYDRTLIECPDLRTKRKPRTMKYILNAITGSDRFYYLGYGAASEIVHGSAHGMEQLFRQTEGGAISGRIEYEPSEFNHDLVQLAGYTISFCEIYVKRFNQPLQDVLKQLTIRYEALAQRYAAPSTVGE